MRKIAVQLRNQESPVVIDGDSVEEKKEPSPPSWLIVRNEGAVVGQFNLDYVDGWWDAGLQN